MRQVDLDAVAGGNAIPPTILATIWPAVADDDLERTAKRVRNAVELGPTRTMVEEAAYGIRRLVDVALKALSPGINDPTTAQDAIFHLGTLLQVRLTSPLPAPAYRGDDGRRLLMPEAFTDED